MCIRLIFVFLNPVIFYVNNESNDNFLKALYIRDVDIFLFQSSLAHLFLLYQGFEFSRKW